MSRLVATLQAVARHEVQRRPTCELAVVTSVFDGDDDDAQSVSVQLKDTGEVIPRVPVAVPLTGLAALPRLDDVVLVAFPAGELASAIVIAQVYSDARRPPPCDADQVHLVWPGDAADPETEAVDVSIRRSDDGREVVIAIGGDADATARVADGAIELTSGGVELSLTHSSSSDGVAALTAGGTKVELAQDGDVTVETSGGVTIKAATISLEADVSVTINGQTVEVN